MNGSSNGCWPFANLKHAVYCELFTGAKFHGMRPDFFYFCGTNAWRSHQLMAMPHMRTEKTTKKQACATTVIFLFWRPSLLWKYQDCHCGWATGEPSHLHGYKLASFPSLPRFFVCVHNAWERKIGEKQRRPGSIHHMSGCKVDTGGEGPIFKYLRAKLESEFLTGQDE